MRCPTAGWTGSITTTICNSFPSHFHIETLSTTVVNETRAPNTEKGLWEFVRKAVETFEWEAENRSLGDESERAGHASASSDDFPEGLFSGCVCEGDLKRKINWKWSFQLFYDSNCFFPFGTLVPLLTFSLLNRLMHTSFSPNPFPYNQMKNSHTFQFRHTLRATQKAFRKMKSKFKIHFWINMLNSLVRSEGERSAHRNLLFIHYSWVMLGQADIQL